MQVQELTMREFLAHLRRHPMPEIIDDECLAALTNVEAQYGGTITHLGGLEVRLGEDARYVDYIMNIDTDEIPACQTFGMKSITLSSPEAGISSRVFLPTPTQGQKALRNWQGIGTASCRLSWAKSGQKRSVLRWITSLLRCRRERTLSRSVRCPAVGSWTSCGS